MNDPAAVASVGCTISLPPAPAANLTVNVPIPGLSVEILAGCTTKVRVLAPALAVTLTGAVAAEPAPVSSIVKSEAAILEVFNTVPTGKVKVIQCPPEIATMESNVDKVAEAAGDVPTVAPVGV